MFKKLILSGIFCIFAVMVAAAQSSDYQKTEFYGGYSMNQVNSGSGRLGDTYEMYHGFEAAGVYNVHRYFGIKGDFSGNYKNNKTVVSLGSGSEIVFKDNRSVYNVLAGVQVKDNSSKARFKPFAHALVGVGIYRDKFSSSSNCNTANSACSFTIFPVSSSNNDNKGLAGAFGGGLDVRITGRISLRAFQADYNPIRIYGATANNIRFGAGIVF